MGCTARKAQPPYVKAAGALSQSFCVDGFGRPSPAAGALRRFANLLHLN